MPITFKDIDSLIKRYEEKEYLSSELHKILKTLNKYQNDITGTYDSVNYCIFCYKLENDPHGDDCPFAILGRILDVNH